VTRTKKPNLEKAGEARVWGEQEVKWGKQEMNQASCQAAVVEKEGFHGGGKGKDEKSPGIT